ncbi:hypothetical protein THIOKS12540004 [Thiocapsa sp. KS1]|nr:hypothetical protein THIOKS12540004 [Thiocapsa sp. KS1]
MVPSRRPRKFHAEWWKARINRQQEIDASIAAKADSEYLYDKPYTDKKTVRVSGPFTVESLSPHRVLGVDENDELIDPANSVANPDAGYGDKPTFSQMILDNLKVAGVQQAHKAEIDEDAWASLNSDTSRLFPKPASGRIAVKVINHLGDEVMKVFRVTPP